MLIDAFFEGGGILGISFIGAYKALSERGVRIDRAVGISAGAMIAALITSGYSANELIELLIECDLDIFKQKMPIATKNYIGKPLSLLYNRGIYDSRPIEQFMHEALLQKGIESFNSLKMNDESRLKIVTTDITNHRLLLIPDDLPEYGVREDYLNIAKAVRMSCAIPLFYTPVEFYANGRVNYIIDGGIIKNIPAGLLYKDHQLRKPTFRFRIKDKGNFVLNGISLLRSPVHGDELEKLLVIENDSGVKATNFDLKSQDIINLYKQGYKAGLRFIKENE